MFEQTDKGAFWTFVTEKALAFASGDNDRLAAVALARFLSEFGVEFHWHETLRFDIAGWEDIEAKASSLSDPGLVKLTPEASFTFAVQLSGTVEPIACIPGLTYASRWRELVAANPDGVPVGQLLTAADWLRCFPNHWTPCAEVAQAKTLAAAAAA